MNDDSYGIIKKDTFFLTTQARNILLSCVVLILKYVLCTMLEDPFKSSNKKSGDNSEPILREGSQQRRWRETKLGSNCSQVMSQRRWDLWLDPHFTCTA